MKLKKRPLFCFLEGTDLVPSGGNTDLHDIISGVANDDCTGNTVLKPEYREC
jgi:hypothetical protein